ncbi:ATP-binding protein [Actinoplanes subtropicus]|uniref:ATP-binding protein n=1 Tax=Actinoplanes subtropicus TaxID=543632 RepID=UPI0004C37495|nr:LuxR family transcriptional regulator [Actinoplanes subtropicus]
MSDHLFGREAELARLTRILDDTMDGAGGRHVLIGQAGIGKSRLLRAVVEPARERGLAVAAREAFRHDQAAPLVTLAGALRDCRPALPEFEWLTRLEPERAKAFVTLQLLRRSLEDAARERPLLIVIDDAQWTDELSALAVRDLVPALAAAPVCWLIAARPPSPDDRESPGQQLVRWLLRDGTPPIRVPALDEEAIARLCAAVVGAKVDSTVVALAASCAGHPLRTEKLMKALVATGQLVVAGGVGSVVGDELPSSFVDSVRDLLATLTEPAGQLVRAVSVFGRPFTVAEAARLAGRPAVELFPLVEEAMTDFLAEDQDGQLAFAHDLVGQAVYGMLARGMREHLHREVAAITRDAGRSPLEVADHQLRGGRDGAADAARLVRAMPAELARVAPSAAADIMLRALSGSAPGDPGRAALIADTVGLLANAARLEEARKLGEEALRAGLDPATAARLLHGLAEAYKHSGLNEISLRYADQAIAQPGVPEGLLARLYAVRAHALHYLDELPAADASGERADLLGRRAGEPGAAVFGLTARGLVAFTEGRLADALRHTREATELADRSGGGALNRHPGIWLGGMLTVLDRFDQAERVFQRVVRDTDRAGTVWAEPLLHYFKTTMWYARGRLDEATVEAETGAAVAEQHGANALAMPLLGMLVRIAVCRGDLKRAGRHQADLRRLADGGITAPPEDVLWAEAVLLAATGSARDAFHLLRDFYATLPRRPALLAADPVAAAELVRIALDAGDRGQAEVAARAARRLADQHPGVHGLAGGALFAEGLLHADATLRSQAAEEFGLAGRPRARAAALADDRGDATADPAPESLLERLTETERKVAMEAAGGLTNTEIAAKLFMSVHTVDTHMRHIFRKLGVRRRSEVARIVEREAGAGPANT